MAATRIGMELENYEENAQRLQEASDKLLSHMKGHDYSFRREITDARGQFDQEKLHGLVKQLLTRWEEKHRNATDMDPNTKESLAEPYLQKRRELYGAFLYLGMRSSLQKEGYTLVFRGADAKDLTTFSFLLEQAKRISRDWCVMSDTKLNELLYGYDDYFGLHLYQILNNPRQAFYGGTLTPDQERPMYRIDSITNEGNMKRIFIKHHRSVSRTSDAEAPAQEKTDAYDAMGNYDDLDDYGDLDDYDDLVDYDDDRDLLNAYEFEYDYDWMEAEGARMAEEDEKAYQWTELAENFEGKEEYFSACKLFKERFEQADPAVLRSFYEELEKIVDLYLAEQGHCPLADMDKMLDVYNRMINEPCRQARRYARGMQWNNL